MLQPLNDVFTPSRWIIPIRHLLGQVHPPIEWKQLLLLNIQYPIGKQQVVGTVIPIIKHQHRLELQVDVIHQIRSESTGKVQYLQLFPNVTHHFDLRERRPKPITFFSINKELTVGLTKAQISVIC